MLINPSTEPAVYNTSSLKCIRAGSPARRGRCFFPLFLMLCVFYFAGQWSKDFSTPGILHTHSRVFPHHAGHSSQWLWHEIRGFCGACRRTSLHCSLSTISCLFLLIHLSPAWFHSSSQIFPPTSSNFSPSCCQSTPLWLFPLSSSFSPSSSTSAPSTAPSHPKGFRLP